MAVVYCESDCTMQEALDCLLRAGKPQGAWAVVPSVDYPGLASILVKTGTYELALHKHVRVCAPDFSMQVYHDRWGALRLERCYKWEEFWDMMGSVYGLALDHQVIVEEDDLAVEGVSQGLATLDFCTQEGVRDYGQPPGSGALLAAPGASVCS